jgi:hypothetical protein
MEKRESSAWLITVIVGIIAIATGFAAFHEKYGLKGEMESMGTSLLMVMKNTQRGRLASYDKIPEEDLTKREKKNKTIIEYDLKNIKQVEQAIGLEVPDE